MNNNRPLWSAGEIIPAYKVQKRSMGVQVTSSKIAFEYIKPIYEGTLNHKEMIYAIYMSRSNQIIGHSIISSGGVSACVCDPKIVFQNALICNASAVILVHNHPSGNLKPSRSDDELTKNIKQGAEILNMTLLDHLILGEDEDKIKYFSYADEGKL